MDDGAGRSGVEAAAAVAGWVAEDRRQGREEGWRRIGMRGRTSADRGPVAFVDERSIVAGRLLVDMTEKS